MSETLIALVIIGIIAAICVPSLAQFVKKREASEKIKKYWSTMKQVERKAYTDGNDWKEFWETATIEPDVAYETVEPFAKKYVLPYINYHDYKIISNRPTIYFADGTAFYMYKGSCINFIWDFNGDKKPNVEGRDRFHFLFCKSNPKFDAYINNGDSRETARNNCIGYGARCSGLLKIDSWEFKDDYPYRL